MSETSPNRDPLKTPKTPTTVVIFTLTHRIEGTIHALPGARLTDFMNTSMGQTFLPVTEATVSPLSGDAPPYTPDFLNVNRNHITLILLQGTRPGKPSVG